MDIEKLKRMITKAFERERRNDEVRTVNKIQPRQDGHDMGLQSKEC